jgi:sarcosine oxidase subunit alpha
LSRLETLEAVNRLIDWRIYEHPILEFDRGKEVTIYLDGKPLKAYSNETVAAALYANGIIVFSKSIKYHRPRGFFCGIGHCSACMMEVDGVPNVKTCVTKVKNGMQVKRQQTFADHLSPLLNKLTLSPLTYIKMFTRPWIIYEPSMKIMRQFTGTGSFPRTIESDSTSEAVVSNYEEISTEFLVIGGGPAGLSAAIEAGNLCKDVVVVDDKEEFGGQLVKQTHMFFSDVKYAAGKRGFKLAEELIGNLSDLETVRTFTDTTAVAYYPSENAVLLKRSDTSMLKIRAKKYLISTGAYEKTLVFENNDLPGVYGAGGVQTLLNVYGIKPGERGLMIGTGNVSLIVAYHLLQAGIAVEAIVAPSFRRVRGYLVHAAKVRRHGVPIITQHTILKALGKNRVEGAIIVGLDDGYNPISGTERRVDCDFICIGVGLNPAYDLIQLFNAKMTFVPQLGGFVPVRDKHLRITENAYVAGDCSGIEEATTAVLEGRLAGLHVAISLGYSDEVVLSKISEYKLALEEDRRSSFSATVRTALQSIPVENIEEVLISGGRS